MDGDRIFGWVTAMLINSVVDFNLYVPANAAVFVWICGLAVGLTPATLIPVSPRIISRSGMEDERGF